MFPVHDSEGHPPGFAGAYMSDPLTDTRSFGNEMPDAWLGRDVLSKEHADSSDFDLQRRVQLLEAEMTSLLQLVGDLLYKNERLRQTIASATS
jgi:hypothetical protein